MVELLSVQKVILYDGQERTRSAPAQAQLPVQFQVQQLQAEAQTEPEPLAVNPAEAGEGTGKRPYDEYSEEPPKTPIGLYRLVSDEGGEPAVEFDDPEGNPAEEPAEDTRKTTTSTETTEAPQTAGIMSNGAAAPKEARTAATVEGISWIEAEFSVTSVNTASGAPRPPQTAYKRSAARRPMGVDALESPSRFAVTFALTASMACASLDASPNSGRSTGRSRRAIAPASPAREMTSIIPDQKHIRPVMDTSRATACPAPSAMAAVTCPSLPVAAPQTKLSTRKAAQIHESNLRSPFQGHTAYGLAPPSYGRRRRN